MKKSNVRGLTISAMIACLYVVLTLIPGLSAIAFGPVQLRVSEALCVLPLLTPWAIFGLGVGCFISNLIASPMILDIVFGTLATLLGAVFTYLLKKHRFIALLMPVIFNGVIIGTELTLFWAETKFGIPLLLTNMLSVAAGEAVSCFLLGYPLFRALSARNFFS